MDNIKIGLEIHQQLDTHKLFCNCQSILRNDEPKFQVRRKLHAVAGESGEIDIAASYEVSRDREFVYQGYDTTCLVELDESPPELINQEALQIALHIAILLNCEIIPITQIMRKTVVDGSNTSGFQRTTLIARNGYIDCSFGRVRINNISLEEDAARIVERKKDGEKNKEIVIFRLDRLGVPLIEIGTAPDIKTAEQCKETALLIGDILRSCKVKRGIGTIRQDVNISYKNHPRVEIKGFQDVKTFISVINNEINRQEENLKNKKAKSEVRNALTNGQTEFLRPMPGSARMYPETDLPLLRISREIINEAKRTLPKLRQELRQELTRKGLRVDEIRILLKQNKLEEFEVLLKLIDEPRFIFKVLIEIPREISAKEKKTDEEIENILNFDVIEDVVNYVKNRKINKDQVKHVMEEIVRGKKLEDAVKIEKVELSEIESEVIKLIKEKPGLSIGAYMGLIMERFKGKISGKEVSEILQKLLK